MNCVKRISFFFVFSFLPLLLFSQIKVDPHEWNLGIVSQGEIYSGSITLRNNGNETISVSLMSTCSCLNVAESEGDLMPGESRSFGLTYDTSDDTADFEKILIIRTSDPSLSKAFFLVYGKIEGSSNKRVETPLQGAAEINDDAGSIGFDYFYDPGCRSCQEFLEGYVPELSRKLNRAIVITRKEINRPEIYEELESLISSRNVEWRSVPVLVSEGVILQGEKDIYDNLEAVVKGEYSASFEDDSYSKGLDKRFSELLIPIVIAGLIDGVNPCAFTTLIFLISALTVAGRSKREIFLIGLFFSAAVYFTYFFVGAGFFSLLKAAGGFSLIAMIIHWALIIILVVFGILSLFDYSRIKQGRPESIILQLPGSIKKRIHGTIRTRMRSAALIGSSLVLGFLISLFELGCTGQIYFPTLTYMIQRQEGVAGWVLLGIYNLAFIIPLLVVFFALFFGYSSQRLTVLFKNKMGTIKLFTALLFFSLALLTYFT
jgi:cytochrome c biogenesis protein CcdA